MLRQILLIVILLTGAWSVRGQNDEVPRELGKRFERYARAWKHRDWNVIYDLTAPNIQKLLLQDSESETQEEWVRHQEKEIKDKINSLEATASYRLSDVLFTLSIVTKGKHPDGKEFSSESYASFQLFEGRWYLVEPVPPKAAMDIRRKERERERDKKP